MNATRWPSLTEFAKFLGREGICRVEEGDKGLEVAWIDNSPEALRRQDAIRKKERQDRGDEEREQKLIREQIEKARKDAEEKGENEIGEEEGLLQREEGEKIKLNFVSKVGTMKQPSPPIQPAAVKLDDYTTTNAPDDKIDISITTSPASEPTSQPEKLALKLSTATKPGNVFAAASKKNALGGAKGLPKEIPKKPMSEAERIMKEEIERKRTRGANGFPGIGAKRQKIS